MTFHSRFDGSFSADAARAEAFDRATLRVLSPLEEELALMDTAIPLSLVPEWEDDGEDNDLARMNLFGPVMDDGSDPEAANFLREPRHSRVAQSRVVALRRRALRAQLRRPLPAWPLPGGQNEDDLRDMRSRIYAPDAETLAAEDKPSIPLRVATHAISLSLVATALPVGAAMMTYNLLKGEDIKATARLTTLTGLALAIIAGNPQLAQIIGA